MKDPAVIADESASTDGSDAIHEPLATPAGSDFVLAFG
jgi:hypothetical protein